MRDVLRRCGLAALLAIVVATAMPQPLEAQGPTATATPTPSAARDEFVPLDELPPEAELPAAPLVVAAYSAIWVLVLLYVWSLSRRLTRVQREIDEVRRQ